ncbi:MAG: sigma-70 family RNA polymerase sigma factor [Lachnospiraceae bacterium]|nr:sigma-70 family RNA polymerase sigma factor [Lachnospiraceae bacterium]
MRGKRPKEREKYVIRLGDGTLVEVNREIYLEWYRSERRERYQKERDRKYGVCSLEGLQEKGCFSEMVADLGNVTEEIALMNINKELLRVALRKLLDQDIRMLELLYFKDITIKETAKILGCSRKLIGNKRKKLLEKLHRMMKENIGGAG